MGLSRVHCFGFLGVFAVVSGIVSFAAYDSLYDYIMKMVSNWNNIFTMNMNDDIFTKNSIQSLYIMKMVSNWELKHSPHMNDDDLQRVAVKACFQNWTFSEAFNNN